MRWIYGKQDWKTFERGQENCFLMTNYLGGFSSLTMLGSASRNDHAVLMASTQAPNKRYNMLHRLAERLEIDGEAFWLSSQEFADEETGERLQRREDGRRYLSCFTYEDIPEWRFQVKGVEICKRMGLKRGANAVAVHYEICNRGRRSACLEVMPFFQFTPKGGDVEKQQSFAFDAAQREIASNGLHLYLRTDGCVKEIPERTETYFYSYDVCDGRRGFGHARANHRISCAVQPGERKSLEFIYEMERAKDTAEEIFASIKEYRRELADLSGFTQKDARMLVKSADQFITRRESTNAETILAGFPFFEDWGRDTMIALPGLCISTRRYESAKQILRTFAANERDGLMPNLFPEGGKKPEYNTVDAALLFINCVYLYYQATKDAAFVREVYPVMERIIEGYAKGTQYGIRLDEDGLIRAGEGLYQVTWMDVRYEDILPTARHGKPVEINAYWYNALRVMETFGEVLAADSKADTAQMKDGGAAAAADGGEAGPMTGRDYRKMAEKTRASFTEKFWMEEKGCLRDVLSGTAADEQIRCNQIWAVSMPFAMLDREKERRVVDTVFEKLYTPYGLRTLDEGDEEFHADYGGSTFERDMAYHQGTVWAFPLGAYYLAYLKVQDYSESAKEEVKSQLEVLESAMREGCIGQLPEIYDGENPTSSRGCFAQAWSVGEILRVYEALETKM